MNPDGLHRLTDSERAVLRELLRHGHQGSVARALNLSPETVKTHLRNAREKCGASASFALARLLAESERSTPKEVMPRLGGGTITPHPVNSKASEPEKRDGMGDEVREERVAFGFQGMPMPATEERHDTGTHGSGALKRLLLAGALVLIVTLAIILAFPLSESFQRLANVVAPPNQ